MNKLIITGASGFIGRHLVKRLFSSGLSSLVLMSNTSNFSYTHSLGEKLESEKMTSYHVDIRNKREILDIFAYEKPNMCIHLAAKIGIGDSMESPKDLTDTNVNGTINVLDACHTNQVNGFIFASSAAVYGNVRELPISENRPLAPLSPYGTSKMLAEQHVSSYSKLKKIQNAVILRIFNVYGSGQASESDLITSFAIRMSKRLPPVIYGDGKRTRDFISVDDVVEGFLLSIKLIEADDKIKHMNSPVVFNIGTGIPTSINELTNKMMKLFGYDLDPIYYKEGIDSKVILHSCADTTKSREILGFVTKKAIDVGLKEMIEPMTLRK